MVYHGNARVPELGWSPIIFMDIIGSLDGSLPPIEVAVSVPMEFKKTQDSWHEQNTSPKSTLPETND